MVAKEAKERQKVAPDGGYGWLVVLGVSVCNLATRSLEPSFGLLFYDLLKELDVETTGASVIMSTREATVNFSGMFVGPLMRSYSFRKMALFGSLLSAVGLMLTAPATSMTHILATYSIMSGLGVGFVWSSTLVAVNHYFSKFRGQATGLSMAGTAVGFMMMPQIVQLLLDAYDFYWAVLILGAISLHGIVGATLLQPVEWHLKSAEDQIKVVKNNQEISDAIEAESLLQVGPKIEITSVGAKSNDVENQTPKMAEKMQQMPRIVSTSSMTAAAAARKRKESIISTISNMDFTGSTFHVNTEIEAANEEDETYLTSSGNKSRKSQIELQCTANEISKIEANSKSKIEIKTGHQQQISYWQRIVKFMDLDLLKDPVYLNIIFGISLLFVAELNFKVIIPFFMADLGYSKSETAFCLSMMAVSDIVARVVLPPIFDRVNITRRTIFVVFSILLGISRSILAEQTEYVPFITTMVISGLFRGAALINCPLSISEHCSLDKLPAAFGLYMVAKGIVIVALGPVIGLIRDVSGSYPLCIHAQTVLIFLCSLSWGMEYVVRKLGSRHKTNENI